MMQQPGWRFFLRSLVVLFALLPPQNLINAEPYHSGGDNRIHSVFDEHRVTVRPGLRGVFVYTYDPSTTGADVFVQQVDQSTYDKFYSTKQFVSSPKNISSSFDFLRLLDDRCDVAIKCRPCETPATPRTTPATTPKTTPKPTPVTEPKTTPRTTPRTTPKTSTPAPTYLPPTTTQGRILTTPKTKPDESTPFRGPTYLPISKKTTTRGPTTPPPTYTYKPRTYSFAEHTYIPHTYVVGTHSPFTWSPPPSRASISYGTTTKAPLYSGEYIFPNGTRSGPISETLRKFYDKLYAEERKLGKDYNAKIYEKEEKEGYYSKFRV